VWLELILGVAPLVKDTNFAEQSDATEASSLVLSTPRTDWEPHAEIALNQYSADTRLRSGQLATKQSALALLNRPALTLELRLLLGYELTLRWGVHPLFDPLNLRRYPSRWFALCTE
jgi:hypothetical protein